MADLIASSHFKSNRVYELRAQTININSDGKIIKSRLKAKDEQIGSPDNNYMNILEIEFPDVRVGSIIEYEVNIPTIEVVNPEPWYFQQSLPVIHSELQIFCPENINYAVKTYNAVLDIAETIDQTILIGYQTGSRNYHGYQIQLVKKNIPAADIDIPDYERIYQKIILEFAGLEPYVPYIERLFKATDPNFKFKNKTAKQATFQNNSYILYKQPSLTSLPEKMLKDPEFDPRPSLPSEIGDSIRALTANVNDKHEQINIIYNFISKHMTWDGTFRTSVNPNQNISLSKPFKSQEGTNAEINFILINVLRRAGFNANPVLASTKDNGSIDPEFFNLHQFNHILALVEIDGEDILVDAVHNENGISILENQEIYPVGLVINEKEAYWINIHDQNN